MHRQSARGLLILAGLTLALPLSTPAFAADVDEARAAEQQRQPIPALDAPLAYRSHMNAVKPVGDYSIAVGGYGMIVRIDQDGTWKQANSPVDVMLNRVYFVDDQRGWAVGHDGAIVHSADGGANWELQRWAPDDRALYDIHFFDAQRGIAIGGYGTYLVTDDGGESWEQQHHDITDIGQHFYQVITLADGTLFMVGERGLLTFSTDEAQSWSLIDSPYTGSLFGTLPWGESGALIFGLRGNMFVTDSVRDLPTMDWLDWDLFERESVTDEDELAAIGWRHIPSPVAESFFGGTRETDDTMLLVGINGHVIRVNARDATAERMHTPDLDNLGDILIDAEGWLVAGRSGLQRLSLTGARR